MARRHISHGFYRVSDREAGQLARKTGRRLPRHGYELAVDEDGKRYWLARTPVSTDAYGFKAPRRGWVWSVRER